MGTPKDNIRRNCGPFRATQLWNDIIVHLKENVALKRRRIRKIGDYDHCFSGSAAVDVVLQYLTEDPSQFSREINRTNALKLCKLLMGHNIFEPVTSSRSNEFEDNPSKYYRFIVEDDNDGDMQDSDAESDKENKSSLDITITSTQSESQKNSDVKGDYVYSNPLMFNKSGQLAQELLDITGAWKRYSHECLRKLTPAKLFQARRPSLPEQCVYDEDFSPPTVPPAVEEEIWREVVLSRLLQLVELPILDGILSYQHVLNKPQAKNPVTSTPLIKRPHHSKSTMAFSNLAFKRQDSICSMFENRNEDGWLEAAIDCLVCLPKGMDILDISLSEDTNMTQKLRLYQSLVDQYKLQSEPIWSNKFADLQTALFNLLMQSRRDVALNALRLSMALLPREIQEEMKRVLTFMKVASEDEAVKLNVKRDNRSQIQNSISPAILKHKVLAPQQAGQLVMFMMDHVEELFICPTEVQQEVTTKLNLLLNGHKVEKSDTTFCERVSEQEFVKQRTEETDQALVDMMNGTLDDTSISLKEKKTRLKQFSKYYPQLYKAHFADIH